MSAASVAGSIRSPGLLPVYDEAASERHFARTLELWRRNLSREWTGA